MIYVLYKNSGVHSGRALRKELRKSTNIPVGGGFPAHLAQRLRKNKPTLIINLGTTEMSVDTPTLNELEMVRAAANKKAARRLFAENGTPSPKFFESPRIVTQQDLPVVGRTSFHSKGKGFWFCASLKSVQSAAARGATHFIKFIPNTREYRVHTFVKTKCITKDKRERTLDDYISLKISEKVWEGEGQPNPEHYQKNHEFGWVFKGQQNRREEELDVVRTAAKLAAATLGIDFGAVDVMYSIRQKQAYVLEVNSTPSLADEQSDTCERYAARFIKIIDGLGISN